MNALLRLLLPFLILLVAGCARFPLGPGVIFGDEKRIAAEINRLRGQARVLRYSGRYVEALERLDTALGLRPNDAELQAERAETEKGWRQLEQALRDELLVIEARAAQRRLPLLRRLVRASPEEQGLRDELNGMRKDQNRQAAALSACGRRRAEHDPALASQCLGLALAAREDAADRALLKRLRPPATPAGKPQTRKSTTAGAAGATEKPRVAEARDLMKAGKHYAAILLLDKMLDEDPGSMTALNLLQEAQASLERIMDNMLSTGDRLYRQGRVKGALAVWQAAVEMDPESIPAREKSERALRVLHNINTLREQQ
jgi:tetratricopeptide (TPR) repeat protein